MHVVTHRWNDESRSHKPRRMGPGPVRNRALGRDDAVERAAASHAPGVSGIRITRAGDDSEANTIASFEITETYACRTTPPAFMPPSITSSVPVT